MCRGHDLSLIESLGSDVRSMAESGKIQQPQKYPVMHAERPHHVICTCQSLRIVFFKCFFHCIPSFPKAPPYGSQASGVASLSMCGAARRLRRFCRESFGRYRAANSFRDLLASSSHCDTLYPNIGIVKPHTRVQYGQLQGSHNMPRCSNLGP